MKARLCASSSRSPPRCPWYRARVGGVADLFSDPPQSMKDSFFEGLFKNSALTLRAEESWSSRPTLKLLPRRWRSCQATPTCWPRVPRMRGSDPEAYSAKKLVQNISNLYREAAQETGSFDDRFSGGLFRELFPALFLQRRVRRENRSSLPSLRDRRALELMRPVPTSGGLSIFLPVLVFLALRWSVLSITYLVPMLGILALGFIDDRYRINAVKKRWSKPPAFLSGLPFGFPDHDRPFAATPLADGPVRDIFHQRIQSTRQYGRNSRWTLHSDPPCSSPSFSGWTPQIRSR